MYNFFSYSSANDSLRIAKVKKYIFVHFSAVLRTLGLYLYFLTHKPNKTKIERIKTRSSKRVDKYIINYHKNQNDNLRILGSFITWTPVFAKHYIWLKTNYGYQTRWLKVLFFVRLKKMTIQPLCYITKAKFIFYRIEKKKKQASRASNTLCCISNASVTVINIV